MRDIKRVIVHCSDSNPNATVDDIRRWHTDPVEKGGRGWKDIGYHWVIYPDGTIHAGRSTLDPGAHCEGENQDSIGICLVGRKGFPKAQLIALADLVENCGREYGFSVPEGVSGHKDWPSAKAQGKTCPNFDVKDLWKVED